MDADAGSMAGACLFEDGFNDVLGFRRGEVRAPMEATEGGEAKRLRSLEPLRTGWHDAIVPPASPVPSARTSGAYSWATGRTCYPVHNEVSNLANLQPLLYIGIPAILILAGMFFNWSAANGIRSEVKDVRSEVRELRSEVYSRLEKVEAKLEDVKDSNHKDALEIMRQMTALHERVAIVESKQK